MWAAAFTVLLMTANGQAKDIACDANVLRESWNLLAQARYGQSDYEYGAFIVRDDNGRLRLSAWKFDHEFLSAHFAGAVPPGVVAITHTHPNSTPLPSDGDVDLARRTGLTVYVLTRMVISATNGHRTRIVVSRDWRPVQSDNQVTGGCDTTAGK